jgi:hypothetical protein
MDQIRRSTFFDRSESGDLLITPAMSGHRVAVYSITAQGHEDGQVVQLRGSPDGSSFAARHWPIKCGDGTGAGESLGGATPIALLPAGEALYLTTSAAGRVAGNVVWDYLPWSG